MKRTINVIYIGGPTIIIEIDGFRIMTDPTLDPSGTNYPAGEHTSIQKLTDPAISDFGKIDLVLLSHDQHGDNLDKTGRELLQQVPLTLTTRAGAERLKGTAKGLEPWESYALNLPDGDELIVTATPARHGPAGAEQLAGDVIGFVLMTKSGNIPEVYLTGDTVFYEGVKGVSELFKPQYVFVFAGAAKPMTPFNLTMGTNDAVDTASAFPDSTIIPLHFEGWSHYSETGEMLIQAFGALGIGERLKILPAGIITTLA
jgi:L-ascorbate metabolism protein UlaG (beta-lactamase superfamily)